jgi:putative ABC transport system ATP-binding protein
LKSFQSKGGQDLLDEKTESAKDVAMNLNQLDPSHNGLVIETIDLHKEFKRDEFQVIALQNANLRIRRGEFVALMGPSGSGKSTLLYLIAAIDRPSRGRVRVLGQDLQELSDKEIARWRNEHVGFVFQTFNLIPVLTARENVELPLLLTNLAKKDRTEHAETALKLVGLGDRMSHYPRQLSGGQEQRVAIARAIVTDPALILADEPTGDLDANSAQEVLTILSKLNKEHGKTIVMVTHDPHAARFANKTRYLEKGELLPEGSVPEM